MMTLMTPKEIKSIAVHADDKRIEVYTPLLNQYMHEYKICGAERESAFLATIIHERLFQIHEGDSEWGCLRG